MNKLKILGKKLLVIVLYLIGIIPIISCLVVIYWFYFGNNSPETHKKLTYAIYTSAFITLFTVISNGIKPFFSFIPEHWVIYFDEGAWESTREVISFFLSLGASSFIVHLLNEHKRLTKKIVELETNDGRNPYFKKYTQQALASFDEKKGLENE